MRTWAACKHCAVAVIVALRLNPSVTFWDAMPVEKTFPRVMLAVTEGEDEPSPGLDDVLPLPLVVLLKLPNTE